MLEGLWLFLPGVFAFLAAALLWKRFGQEPARYLLALSAILLWAAFGIFLFFFVAPRLTPHMIGASINFSPESFRAALCMKLRGRYRR
jgi:hypothetical protein